MRKRVLVVDDDPDVRRVLIRELRQEFEVIEVGGCLEALLALENASRLYAVVSDLDMPPGPDGVELLTEVHRRAPRAFRLLVSGGNARRATRAVASGIVHKFIAKPWKFGEILAAVQRWDREVESES